MILLIYRIYSTFCNCPITVFYRIEIFFFLSGTNQGSHIALISWVRVKSGWTLRCRTIQKKTSTLWFHLSTQSSQFIETESTMVVAWGWERGEWTLLFNGCRCSVFQSENSSGGQLHNNVNVLNTTELNIWKLLRW